VKKQRNSPGRNGNTEKEKIFSKREVYLSTENVTFWK
jgi:hypothetical protein